MLEETHIGYSRALVECLADILAIRLAASTANLKGGELFYISFVAHG